VDGQVVEVAVPVQPAQATVADLGLDSGDVAGIQLDRRVELHPVGVVAREHAVGHQKRLLLERTPDDTGQRFDLINSLAWQGNVLLADGRLQDAHVQYETAVKEARTLIADDPDDTNHRDLLSSLVHLQALAADRLGEDGQAERLFRESLQISERLVDHDPSNATWRESLVGSRIAIGFLQIRSGRFARAEALLTDAASLAIDLTETDPTNVDYREDLAGALRGLALTAKTSGDSETARRYIDRSVDAARSTLGDGGNRDAVQSLAKGLVLMGEIDLDDGRSARAAASWREALDLIRPLAADGRATPILETLMRALCHLGHTTEAQSVANDLTSMGYARRDFQRFCQAHGLTARLAASGE